MSVARSQLGRFRRGGPGEGVILGNPNSPTTGPSRSRWWDSPVVSDLFDPLAPATSHAAGDPRALGAVALATDGLRFPVSQDDHGPIV